MKGTKAPRRSLRQRLATMGEVLLVLVALLVVGAAVIPAKLGLKGQVVLSGSMEPTFMVGDIVYVKPIAPLGVQRGTVLTFHAPDGRPALITHRVVKVRTTKEGRTFVTRGDNNPANDSLPVHERDIVGTVAFSVPKLGRPILWLREPRHYAWVAAGLFSLVLVVEGRVLVRDVARSLRKRRLRGVLVDPTEDEVMAWRAAAGAPVDLPWVSGLDTS